MFKPNCFWGGNNKNQSLRLISSDPFSSDQIGTKYCQPRHILNFKTSLLNTYILNYPVFHNKYVRDGNWQLALSFVCVISGVCLQLARYCLSETIPTQTSPQTSILFVCSAVSSLGPEWRRVELIVIISLMVARTVGITRLGQSRCRDTTMEAGVLYLEPRI